MSLDKATTDDEKENIYILLMVRDQETEQLDDNFKSYRATYVDARKILIKMEFVEPLKVSQGPEPHLLFI